MTSCTTLESAVDTGSLPQPMVQNVPGTVLDLLLMPVEHDGRIVWISTTEITWDLFDVFVYGDAEEASDHADAVTRPTQPYIAMDRGFGRNGYPAISMSFKAAEQFCIWLSDRTGRTFRLPTVAEWRAACACPCDQSLDDQAWHAGNADRTTHPVGAKRPNPHGLHDMLGNVAEWCVDDDGNGIVLGGSFQTSPHDLTCEYEQHSSPMWNASDPQFPPSQWWLADAPFVGFRVVLEVDPQ